MNTFCSMQQLVGSKGQKKENRRKDTNRSVVQGLQIR